MKLYAVVAAAVLFSAGCNAQQARLTGTWTMDPTRSQSAAQQDATGSSELTIRQTPTQITIRTRQNRAERVVSYNVDGSEVVSPLGADSATGRMKWDGDRLVTDTVYNVAGTALAQTATYSLSDDGREMTVEYKLRVLHGYEGNHPDIEKQDPNYSTGKDVFTRR